MAKGISFIVALVLIVGCTKDFTTNDLQLDVDLKRLISNASPDGSYEFYQLPVHTDLDQIPQDVRNPLTAQKVELGKFLFYETGLAMDANYESGLGTYSCGSCHIPAAGFRAGAPQGVADGGMGFGVNGENRIKNRDYQEDEIDAQSARPLSLINVAYVTNTFWNGQFGGGGVNVGTEDVWHLREDTERNELGFEAIETQNFEGILAHRIASNKELLEQLGYKDMFDEVFPEIPEEERYNTNTASLALSAYIRAIISDKAPFQQWLAGDYGAMSDMEKEGGILFFGKARCANCHYEKNLGSMEFHALGVKDLYQRPSFNTKVSDRRNLGRGGFTLNFEDRFKFRVPQLYNLNDSPFYFHGSSKLTIEEVIDYKIAATSENPNVENELLSEKFSPLNLTSREREALINFIKFSLRDPDLNRYLPTQILSGNCFPNNDPQSVIDLGCN